MSFPDHSERRPSDEPDFESEDSLEIELRSIQPRSTTGDFSGRVVRAAHVQPMTMPPSKFASRKTNPTRRGHPLAIVGAIAAILLISVSGFVSWRFWWEAGRSNEREIAEKEQLQAPSILPEDNIRGEFSERRLPTIALYRSMQRDSSESLDQLLVEHGRNLLPPTENQLDPLKVGIPNSIH